MHELLGLLTIYYACSAAATIGQLTAEEIAQCSFTYEAVKMQFLTQDELELLEIVPPTNRAELMLRGYVRFKTWESEHPRLILDIQLAVNHE